MTTPRDFYLRRYKPTLDAKQNKYEPFRAVICADDGSRTTGDIWKDEDARLVWYQAWGSGSIGWALCDAIEPTIGLGVIIQFNDLIGFHEVMRDDPVQRSATSNRRSYRAITNEDFLQGGRFQLWIDPTMIIPLSIYPGSAGLTVSIVSGDYIYGGDRKTYNGVVDYDISAEQPAGPGEHNLVGLYLNSANALNVITGAAQAVGVDAPEPAWPAGAFRLGVIDINDTQTTVDMMDITNRKVVWTEDDKTFSLSLGDLDDVDVSGATPGDVLTYMPGVYADDWAALPPCCDTMGLDDLTDVDIAGAVNGDTLIYDDGTGIWYPGAGGGSGGGVWAAPGKANLWDVTGDTVTAYATIPAAITAAAAGDVVVIGAGVWDVTGALVTVNKAVYVVGVGRPTVTSNGANEITVTISNASAVWDGIDIKTTSPTGDPRALLLTASATVKNCTVRSDGGGDTTGYSIEIDNCSPILDHVFSYGYDYSVFSHSATGARTVKIWSGYYIGGIATNIEIGNDYNFIVDRPLIVGDINLTGTGQINGEHMNTPHNSLVLDGFSSLTLAGIEINEIVDTSVVMVAPGSDNAVVTEAEIIVYGDANWGGGASVWPLEGDLTNTNDGVSFATVALLIAALAVGEQGIIGNGAYTSDDVDITENIRLLGSGIDATILQTSVDDKVLDFNTGDCLLEGFTLKNTNNPVNAYALYSLSSSLQLTRIKMVLTGASTNNHGAYLAIGTHKLYDCVFNVSGASGSNTALYVDDDTTVDLFNVSIEAGNVSVNYSANPVTVSFYGGVIKGNLAVDGSGATVNLDGCNLLGNLTITNSATVNLINMPRITGTVTGAVNGAFETTSYGNANAWGFVCKNTSGGAVATGDVGYINQDGEFKTTTTASLNENWAVVLIGAANNINCYVTRRGRVNVNYTGGAPSAGDYLVTSTSAGDAQLQTTVSPEIFAVCLGAGAAGVVSALLLAHRTTMFMTSSNDIFSLSSISSSDFVATQNGAPAGANITYNAPSSGSENTINPSSSAQLAKIIIYNTTKGTSAKLLSTNTGTNVMTFSAAADVAAWQNGDTLTTRSTTNTDAIAGTYFYDFELTSSEIPELTVGLIFNHSWIDTGAGNVVGRLHPFQAGAASKRTQFVTQVLGIGISSYITYPIFNKRFQMQWASSGSATATITLRLLGVIVASP